MEDKFIALFMSKLVNGILELIIVSFIPFMTWLIWRRKKVGFFDWIGLKPVQTQQKGRLEQTIFGFTLLFTLFSVVLFSWFDPSKTATADFSGKGIGALPAILAYAILGTALPEEIFFRGFLLKRLQGKLGFLGANLIQSLLFGLIHALMFIQLIGFLKSVMIFAFISLIAYVFGAINEQKAEHTYDGVHLYANAYLKVYEVLEPYLVD